MTGAPPKVAQALLTWPPQSAVARSIAKAKIYAHAKPTAAVRALFVEQVESITWAHKLAPETINLPAKHGVPEIEVFEIVLKQADINHAVLRCIDKAIPLPILFVLRFNGQSQPIAAYKRPSDAAADQWVVGEYHAAAWQSDGLARMGLPVALDLQGLYEQLMRQHIAAPARPSESLREQLDRLSRLAANQTVAAKLEAQLSQEKQFNRKVQINAQLRIIKQELNTLSK
jgi:Domain of unknown function (DUF4391)